MTPEFASPNGPQSLRGTKPAPVAAATPPLLGGFLSSESLQLLGLRGWARPVLEFAPVWLVLAAFAGWFAYGCGAVPPECGSGTLSGAQTVAVGAQMQLTLMDQCSTGSPAPTWSASPSGYLSVDANGNVTGVSATPSGTLVTVTATVASNSSTPGFSATTKLSVTGPTLQSIAISDTDNGVTAVGNSDQFTAIGTYSDQTTQNLTGSVTWNSSLATVATIQTGGAAGPGTGPGFASSVAAGDTSISASVTLGSAAPITASETLTVGTLQSIAVTDADSGMAPNASTDQFTATGTYAGGTIQNLTTFVTWSSANTAVVSFAGNNGVTPPGLAATGVPGSALVTASLPIGGVPSVTVSGTETLTVANVVPTLTSIAVTPASATVAAGLTQQYAATGTYSDGSHKTLTSQATWASSAIGTATINSSGLATGVAAGPATITAALGAITSPGVTLTVTAPILQSITVAPSTASIQVGNTQTYTATGNYSDGSHQPITTGITWTSAPTSVATITSSGVATGVSTGSATVTATVGALTSNSATLTVTAATPPEVSRYLIDLSTNAFSVDAIVPGTGQLRASNTAPIPNADINYPTALLVHPNGKVVYETSVPSIGLQIAAYSLSASGQLTAMGNPVMNNNWGFDSVIDPLGRFIFISDSIDNEYVVIPLDSAGNLGTPAVALSGASSLSPLAIDPTGSYLFVPNGSTMASYSISGTGALTSIGSAAGPTEVSSMAVAPSGNVLYALDGSSRAIYAYSISHGALTALANSPFTVSSNGDGETIAIDPTGKYLYATVQSTDGLFGFTIGSDGALAAMQSGSSFSVGDGPQIVSVDASSQHVYVNNRFSGDIWVYSIASGTGLLTNVSEIRTQGSTAQALVSGSAGLTFTPTALYVANAKNSGGTITQYTVDPSTGSLTGLSMPVAAGGDPKTVATDPFGIYAYDASFGSDAVYGYSVSGSGLTVFPSAPYPAGNGPSWVTTDLSGSFLYSTMQTDGTVWKFDLDSGVPTGGASSVTTSAGPVFITTEPTGQYVYVADYTSATIGMYKIQFPLGGLAAAGSGSLVAGNSQNWIAVDPSGRFAYSADPLSNAVWEFTIGSEGVLTLNSTPNQSVGPSSATPGAGSVAIDPTGKYLYATNISLGQIYLFTIDPTTGLLSLVHTTMSGGEVADPGALPGQLAVDISGKYLYCVTTPTTGSGAINIYSIDPSTGLLTSVGTVNNVPFAAGFALTGTAQ